MNSSLSKDVVSSRSFSNCSAKPFGRVLLYLSLATFLSGCSVYSLRDSGEQVIAAEFEESQPIPNSFSNTSSASSALQNNAQSLDQFTDDNWWTALNQPSLNALMDEALANNLSLTQAQWRLKQAYVLSRQARASLGPELDVEAGITNTWYEGGAESTTGSFGLGLSWQLDLFGQLEYAEQRQLWLARAREQDLRAAKLALTLELASTWLGIQSAWQALELLQDQLTTDRQYLELMQLRYDNGVGTRVEVLQQQSQVLENQSLIPLAEQELHILENRLDVLLGQVPDGRSRVRALALKESAVPLPIIGVPASLLNNRPDLRVARAELIAADADIGIAIANRLPGLTLSGFGGYSDGSSYNGQLGSLSLDLIQPLLDWGRRKAEVSYNKALYQEQLAAFSLAWLEALAEVEDGLLQEHKQRQHLQLLEQRREVLQETLEESEARFTQGVDNYLPVLNTLTSLRALERNLVDQRLALFNLRIQLYGAIGGVIPSTAIPSTTIENSPATGNFDLSASSSTASPTPSLKGDF